MKLLGLAIFLACALIMQDVHASANTVTIENLRAAYPDLPLREVSMAEFNALTRDPLRAAQVVVESKTEEAPTARTNILSGEVKGPEQRAYTTEYRGGDFGLNISGLTSVDSKETAIVVFVVAGVAVIAAAIIYSGALVYNLVARDEEAPPLWWEPHVRSLYFSSGSQQGWMAGGGATFGFESEDAEVGLTLEGGYLNADVQTINDDEVSVDGGYGMVGPVVRWYFGRDKHDYRLDVELLIGGASGYSLISRAGATLTWAATDAWRIGLGFGALYLDVKKSEGPLYEAGDDYNMFVGLHTGLTF